MVEDFVRYYITNDLPLHTFEKVQQDSKKLDEWSLSLGSEFEYKKSYGYREGIGEQDELLLLQALAKRSIIAETRYPQNVKNSIIWKNELIIADVLTLLSVARARYYSILAVEKSLGDHHSIGRGVMIRSSENKCDILPISRLGQFTSEVLTFIEKNPNWLEETGVNPSIYWYTQAQVSYHTGPSVLEMALQWVTLEILAGVHIDGLGLNIPNKKERVKRFLADKGYAGNSWLFLDEVIDDWYQIRNGLFHEGKQAFTKKDVLWKRRKQVRDFVSLVLVETLQKQDETIRNAIASRIQTY